MVTYDIPLLSYTLVFSSSNPIIENCTNVTYDTPLLNNTPVFSGNSSIIVNGYDTSLKFNSTLFWDNYVLTRVRCVPKALTEA